MDFWSCFLLAAAYNVAIGLYAAHGNEEPNSHWRRSRRLRLGLGAGSAVLMFLFVRQAFGGSDGFAASESPLLSIPLMAFLGFTLTPYVVGLFGHTYDSVRAWILSEHKIVVTKTYDQAEAAERRHEWSRAIGLYQTALAEDPADLEARRRLAEIFARQGEHGRAARHLAALLPEIDDREKRATLGFRSADLFARAGDPEGAGRILDGLALDLRGTALEEGVTVRRKRLQRSSASAAR